MGAAAVLAGLVACGPALAQDTLPSIYVADHDPAENIDLIVGPKLEFRLIRSANAAQTGTTRTEGIWRPLDRIAVRAAYQNPPLDHLLLCGEDGYCAPASTRLANEDTPSYALGASWQFSRALNLNVDYSNRQSRLVDAPWESNALSFSGAEAVDVSLTCDIDAGNWGELELGLQVSRFAGMDYRMGQPLDATEPLNGAALGLGWQKGVFRGDLTSRYLDVVNNGQQDNGWSALDISFAWRTPWNASLSVGARNVLNNPAPSTNGLSDAELENFFGRVPYVRYRQDL
ncbi:MAG: TonB-dependent receptor [Pseudomonadota bacterium]